MKPLNVIALILMIIGAINWGLVGLFHYDLVASLFGGEVGPRSGLSNLIYILVGIAGLYGLYLLRPILNDTTGEHYSVRGTDHR